MAVVRPATATSYFQPLPSFVGARARGCFTCTHFHGRMTGHGRGREDLPGVHVVCEHRGGVQVIGTPRNGCAYWEREPGADDE